MQGVRALPARWTLGHRPVLDGFRGAAVLLVLLGHLNVAGFDSGGWVGVTMFFVLSGFLITRLLLEERATTGSISLPRFYARRALRLLPALAALLVVVVGYGMAIGDDQILGRGLAVAGYGANWARILSGDTLGPLAHTWSLAIEEQFYLVWPAALLLVLPRRRPEWVIGGLLVGLVLWRVLLMLGDADPYRIYLGTDTRADALLIGAALAVLIPRLSVPGWVAAVGTAAILAFGAFPDNTGWTAQLVLGLPLTALASAAIIAWSVQRGSAVLSSRALTTVGLLSYAIYLWQLPIVQASGVLGVTPLRAAVAVVLTFAAAVGSYLLVERPALRLKSRLLRRREEERPSWITSRDRSRSSQRPDRSRSG